MDNIFVVQMDKGVLGGASIARVNYIEYVMILEIWTCSLDFIDELQNIITEYYA